MARWLDANNADFESRFAALLAEKRGSGVDVVDTVKAIIADVRARGDAALIDYAAKFDRAELTRDGLRLSEAEIAGAGRACSLEALDALGVAAERIEEYHLRQIPDDAMYRDESGAELGWRWTALDSVGLYVPGGTASYPSSVLMNAIPAKAAGVKRLVMVTPATDGAINPLSIEAARRAGISEIYRVGGAQAVAALAYGTETIAPVDKIVGPGNAYVAAAKREVFGTVGIDSIAGPSEILVIADKHCSPDWIAADLLSQAEHDPSAQSILMTDDAAFAMRIEAALDKALAALPRREIAEKSWRQFGAIVIVPNLEAAAKLANRIAPEHLELAVKAPEALLSRIRHAGAVFLGCHTPEAVGDYLAGPNHVLPTDRTARFSSGLSVLDFLKRSTLIKFDQAALAELGPQAIALAKAEGLEAHARSVSVRLSRARS